MKIQSISIFRMPQNSTKITASPGPTKPPRLILPGIFAFAPNRDTLGATSYLIVDKSGKIRRGGLVVPGLAVIFVEFWGILNIEMLWIFIYWHYHFTFTYLIHSPIIINILI